MNLLLVVVKGGVVKPPLLADPLAVLHSGLTLVVSGHSSIGRIRNSSHGWYILSNFGALSRAFLALSYLGGHHGAVNLSTPIHLGSKILFLVLQDGGPLWRINELIRLLSEFGGSLVIDQSGSLSLKRLLDIWIYHWSNFLALVDGAVVLYHAVILLVHVAVSSLVYDPLVGAIAPKDVRDRSKHPLPRWIFISAGVLGHDGDLDVAACIRNLLKLHLLSNVKELLLGHCAMSPDLIARDSILHITVRILLENLLLSAMTFLLAGVAHFLAVRYHSVYLVLRSRSATASSLNLHR